MVANQLSPLSKDDVEKIRNSVTHEDAQLKKIVGGEKGSVSWISKPSISSDIQAQIVKFIQEFGYQVPVTGSNILRVWDQDKRNKWEQITLPGDPLSETLWAGTGLENYGAFLAISADRDSEVILAPGVQAQTNRAASTVRENEAALNAFKEKYNELCNLPGAFDQKFQGDKKMLEMSFALFMNGQRVDMSNFMSNPSFSSAIKTMIIGELNKNLHHSAGGDGPEAKQYRVVGDIKG